MIYLDNAATSYPKAPGVAAAVAKTLSSPAGNAGRPSSLPGLAAAGILFETREALASLLGVQDSSRFIFTKNATEAINIVLLGAVPLGGTLALSSIEHNAVLRPANLLAAQRGVRLVTYDIDARGRPDPESLRAAMEASPDLLAISAASNVTGATPPFEDIVAECKKRNIPTLVDGSQALGHVPINLKELEATAFCFPGQKGLLGPEGTGGLWLAEGFEPEPLITGGTGTDSASVRQPSVHPDRYEAGTQNGPALAGLGQALDFLLRAGIPAIERREQELRGRLVQGLSGLSPLGLKIYGPQEGDRAVPVVSVSAGPVEVGELAVELGRRSIAARPGLHCAPLTHKTIGTLETGGTLRFSPGYFTTEEEIDRAIAALKEILE